MKKKSLINSLFLALIFFSCDNTPINYETDLHQNKGLFYKMNHNKPYTGMTFSNYKNGNKKSNGELIKGKKNGLWKYWFENGNIKSEENYINGQPDGERILWYENNKLKLKCNFKKGFLDGFQTEWYENGGKKERRKIIHRK